MEIKYFNRHSGKIEVEQVYGDKAIKWFYSAKIGKSLLNIICRAPISVLYGFLQNRKSSTKKIDGFVREFNIPMEEFLPEDGSYSTFNNFFIRKFKAGARAFTEDSQTMPAMCEARYFGFLGVDKSSTVQIKGKHLTPLQILANEQYAKKFEDGPILVARLCPVDYHRFHFPDDGEVIDHYKVPGMLHSVNPIALNAKADILGSNAREVTILKTKNFKKLAFIEVGAVCVGKIVQTYKNNKFGRGDEKGYFLFGGSTVIVMGEKDAWVPSVDILENTKNELETYVKLGSVVATGQGRSGAI